MCFQKIQVQSHRRHRSHLLAGESSPSLMQQLLFISHLAHVECCRRIRWRTGSLCSCRFLCAGDTTEHPNLYVSHCSLTASAAHCVCSEGLSSLKLTTQASWNMPGYQLKLIYQAESWSGANMMRRQHTLFINIFIEINKTKFTFNQPPNLTTRGRFLWKILCEGDYKSHNH